MIVPNPTFNWRSELRDSHSLRAWVILPMRRAALLDMLKVILGQCTSEVVDSDRDGVPREVQVPRCAELHYAELQSFKGRSSQFSTMLHTIGRAG